MLPALDEMTLASHSPAADSMIWRTRESGTYVSRLQEADESVDAEVLCVTHCRHRYSLARLRGSARLSA